jgi:N-acetylneuraminate synthase/sialic acid synthase
MFISGVEINSDSRAFLIAEIGHNHQGDVNQCIRMIEAAADSGASAVKLQKRSNKKLFTKKAFDEPYNSENAYGPTYGLHREALEFSRSQYQDCIAVANEKNVIFFSTAFDFESADFLFDLDVPAFKIASGDLRSIQLIEYVAKMGRPMIISTGGANLADIDRAVEVACAENKNVALLQCTAGYPPLYSEIDLNVIKTYSDRYPQVTVGYSGHDSGIAIAAAAYAIGARVIEKHFTLNRALKGTDHAFSLEPAGFKKLRRDLDRIREAMGDGTKKSYPSEQAPLRKMSKMIVAKSNLNAGDLITMDNIDFKSPCDGLAPNRVNEILGKTLQVAVAQDEPILDISVKND